MNSNENKIWRFCSDSSLTVGFVGNDYAEYWWETNSGNDTDYGKNVGSLSGKAWIMKPEELDKETIACSKIKIEPDESVLVLGPWKVRSKEDLTEKEVNIWLDTLPIWDKTKKWCRYDGEGVRWIQEK